MSQAKYMSQLHYHPKEIIDRLEHERQGITGQYVPKGVKRESKACYCKKKKTAISISACCATRRTSSA